MRLLHVCHVINVHVCMYVPSHGDDPSWFRHLVIDLPKSRSHLIGQCSRHNHHIGLTLKQGRPVITEAGETNYINLLTDPHLVLQYG